VTHEQRNADLHPETERRGISPTLIGLVVLVIATVIFIAQNRDKATIEFLFISVTTRIWAGFLIAVALGVVLDRLFSMWWRRRQER
jgi:uncharacterized integral membrane protein